MKFYIISDTHFNHKEVIEYCGRPENYEDLIFNGIKSITQDDCLIHLGDICIGEDSLIHEKFIQPLKCRKILTLGNHDSKSYSWYMEHGWDFACSVFKIRYCGYKICFSHKPQPWDGDWDINIHGHLHNLGHRDNEFKNLKKWHRLYSVEDFNYKPIELVKFIQEINTLG